MGGSGRAVWDYRILCRVMLYYMCDAKEVFRRCGDCNIDFFGQIYFLAIISPYLVLWLSQNERLRACVL
jgi:hypothetical protein